MVLEVAYLGSARSTGTDLILWALVSTAGFTLVGAALHFPPFGGETFDGGAAAFGALLGAISGVLVGALQRPLLRRLVPGARGWVLATTIGFAAMHAIGDGVPSSVATVTLTGGAVLGAMQWAILRRFFSRAAWWIPATLSSLFIGSTLGLGAAWSLGLMAWTGPAGWGAQHAFVSAVGGLLVGLTTGWLMVRLPRRSGAETTAGSGRAARSP